MTVIAGRKPVLEALKSGEEIELIYLLFGQKGEIIQEIKKLAKKRGIKVKEVPAGRFYAIVKHENAQGIAAAKPMLDYMEFEDLIEYSLQRNKLLLLLDQIQDPHNVGAIIRTAECAGADGIILTRHESAPINETVIKTSAGATEYIKLSIVTNLAQSIKRLKKEGFWIVGSYLGDSVDYQQVDYTVPTALIVGNEEKGIRKLTAEKCDFLVTVPMSGKIESLNVSVATGVLLFEIVNQRRR